MITLGNTLRPSDIRLDLASEDVNSATVELANALRHDRRITDWSRFVSILNERKLCISEKGAATFCLPHARTDSVQTLVMAAGRSKAGLIVPESDEKCHYVFVVGIPSAMDADYLRLIGALARIFRTPGLEKRLRESDTAAEFHEQLVAAEVKV